MTRAHEPFADAIRTARTIVEAQGRALAQAESDAAFDRAYDALVLRIAQAIEEAEADGRAAAASWERFDRG